jgi:hypothetical protein
MTEVVVALYKNARAAETAVADLMVAKVPTTRIVSDPAICAGLLDSCKLGEAPGAGVVAVTVDERHASLVRGIGYAGSRRHNRSRAKDRVNGEAAVRPYRMARTATDCHRGCGQDTPLSLFS